MAGIIYRCPTTDCEVEGREAGSTPSSARPVVTYVADFCAACSGLHIVNPATGRLISEEIAWPTVSQARVER